MDVPFRQFFNALIRFISFRTCDAWHRFTCSVICTCLTGISSAETSLLPRSDHSLRIATFAAPLSEKGAGLLLQKLNKEDPKVLAIQAIINYVNPDVMLLTDFDYDHDQAALSMFSNQLEQPYPYLFAFPPNSGRASGLDLDQDGRLGEPEDSYGYGRFLGDGGLAILSRVPVQHENAFHLNSKLWTDVEGARLPHFQSEPDLYQNVPLSSSGHWAVPLELPSGPPLTLVAFSASPPVFDGPEDHNGLRNRDEIRAVSQMIDGRFGEMSRPFVVLGNANLDPFEGEGYHDVITRLLNDQRLQDPRPKSLGALELQEQHYNGLDAFDTVDWSGVIKTNPDTLETEPLGGLRVSYILPSAELSVINAQVFWPGRNHSDRQLIGDDGLKGGVHRLVYVDLDLKSANPRK